MNSPRRVPRQTKVENAVETVAVTGVETEAVIAEETVDADVVVIEAAAVVVATVEAEVTVVVADVHAATSLEG